MSILRAKFIYEKFTEDSDPIHDMGIGLRFKIKQWLEKYEIKRYTINDDLTIDVHENVNIQCGTQGSFNRQHRRMGNFPKYIQFRKADEDFIISNNNLTTLRGCPYTVGGDFACINNKLKSLKYAPKKVATFWEYGNPVKFTKEDVLKVCNVSVDNINLLS